MRVMPAGDRLVLALVKPGASDYYPPCGFCELFFTYVG